MRSRTYQRPVSGQPAASSSVRPGRADPPLGLSMIDCDASRW